MNIHTTEFGIITKQSPCLPKGFTLIEIMVVLSISAILMSIAVPSYRNFTMDNRLSADINRFNSILQFSRSLAIRNKSSVMICTSTDQTACNLQSTWSKGWIVCETLDGTNCEADSVIKVGSDLSERITLHSTGFSGNNRKILFSSNGTLESGYSRGSFIACDSRGDKKARVIILNPVGRTQKAYDSNNDNYLEQHDGAKAECLA